MSGIIETDAIVLSKLDYGDTSNIISLYSKDKGKLSVILKGGRNPKSKMGMIADPLNLLHVMIYDRASREVQLLSGAEIEQHYPAIKGDFLKLKNALAVLELVKKLSPEHEPNYKLYKGIVRILELLDSSVEDPAISFGRFFMFFLKELGYELQIKNCAICKKGVKGDVELSYNFEIGILCSDCRKNYLESHQISPELFNYLNCLKHNENPGDVPPALIERGNIFMEKYIKHHISDFKGIQTFQMFKEKF